MLGVEEGAVGSGADLINDVGLQIGVDCARNILALACKEWLVLAGAYKGVITHTRLGEEGAEAMVVLGGFAFLGQITIGLDDDLAAVHVNRLTSFTYLNAVLEAVELQTALVMVVFAGCCCAGRGTEKPLEARLEGGGSRTYLPAGVCDLATGLADYTRAKSVSPRCPALGGQGAWARGSWRTVQADDLSHVCGGEVRLLDRGNEMGSALGEKAQALGVEGGAGRSRC